MKIKVTEKSIGAVKGKVVVQITATPEQIVELRQALAVVDRFKTPALRKAGAKEGPHGADWTMVGYAVKSDCVFVTVEQGMCG